MLPIAALLALVVVPASAASFGSGFAASPVGAPFSAGGPPGGAAGPAFGPPGASGFPGYPGAAGAAPGMTMPSEPSCPPTNGMVPLYVPDPDDCTKYTVCSGGFGMKLDCPPGLHFNSVTNHCDYPPLAGCEEIPPEDPTTLTGPPGIKKDAYFDMSLLSGPGFPILLGQPNPGIGQLKNPPGKPSAPATAADWMKLYKGGGDERPQRISTGRNGQSTRWTLSGYPSSSDPDDQMWQSSGQTTTPEPKGSWQTPSSCDKKATQTTTAMGYPTFLFVVFVATITVSVTSAALFASPGGPPANPPPPGGFGGSPGAFGGFGGGAPPAASGGAGGAPPGAGGQPSDPSCPPTDGMVPLYVPDPDDCTKYTVCSAGFGMKMDCAPGLHFNKVTNHCDFPPLAGCEVSA
ncbi:uncharacterized protein LOC142574520 [Dermacentor variabilis]|uniref:uncharacterized protein LOC142574520 n=1 Tax=Dermacentor variabilis TaxID=34621 RepID=UPI003F5C3DF1